MEINGNTANEIYSLLCRQMNIVVKRAFGFGVAHLIVTITCLIASFSLGMERFEEGM
jgi:hypothetical protein